MLDLIRQYFAYIERQKMRKVIMGHKGANVQNNRANRLVGSGPERNLQGAREATRRVGEYKEAEMNQIMQVLDEHADKNFVQRIMSPDSIKPLYDNPGGETSRRTEIYYC